MSRVNPNSPVALALRATQKLDVVASLNGNRHLLVEAQDALGEELGLTCTGSPDSYYETVDGNSVERVGYSHNGGTCKVHEWLVTADSEGLER